MSIVAETMIRQMERRPTLHRLGDLLLWLPKAMAAVEKAKAIMEQRRDPEPAQLPA